MPVLWLVYVILLFIQNGETALHAAALFGHLKVVSQLLGAGVPPSLKNKVQYSGMVSHTVDQHLFHRKHQTEVNLFIHTHVHACTHAGSTHTHRGMHAQTQTYKRAYVGLCVYPGLFLRRCSAINNQLLYIHKARAHNYRQIFAKKFPLWNSEVHCSRMQWDDCTCNNCSNGQFSTVTEVAVLCPRVLYTGVISKAVQLEESLAMIAQCHCSKPPSLGVVLI